MVNFAMAIAPVKLSIYVGIIIFLLPTLASATYLKHYSVEEKVQHSDIIVVATYAGNTSLRDHGRIVTDSQFTGLEIIAHSDSTAAPKASLNIRQLGGVLGNMRSEVHGGAQFVEGERYLLFIHRHSSGLFELVGMSQGAYRLGANNHFTQNLRTPLMSEGGQRIAGHRAELTLSEIYALSFSQDSLVVLP